MKNMKRKRESTAAKELRVKLVPVLHSSTQYRVIEMKGFGARMLF